MTLQFYPLRIAELRRETSDCVSVLFDVPAELQATFRFQQGQYLTLRCDIGGQSVRRSYSICSAPCEGTLRVAIKKQEGGIFSTFANEQLQQGAVVDVMPPNGKFFTPLDPASRKHYLFVAAGSGITPIVSLIKETLVAEPHSSCTLVYGNRNRGGIIFFEELEALKNKYMQRFRLIHVLSREKTDAALHFGRIDENKLAALDRLIDYKTMDACFVCGPEELIHGTRQFLQGKGIAPEKIHFELFGVTSKKSKSGGAASQPGGGVSHITITLDGRSFEFDLPLSSDTTLLDAAAAQGADVPYACKGGVCCTCKAKLLQGEVSMDVHWGLDHEEIEQGYILTCQAHPKTETVVVDFDVK